MANSSDRILLRIVHILNHRLSLPSIVTVGALLTIEGERRYNGPASEGGSAFVSCVHDDGTFDINLTVGGVEKNVHPRLFRIAIHLPPPHVGEVVLMMLQRDLLSYLPTMSLFGVGAHLQIRLRPMSRQLPQIIQPV